MDVPRRHASGFALIDGIPAISIEPDGPARGIALWLAPFGSSAEDMRPFLLRLATAGWAALSIDPLRHGRRAPESGSRGAGPGEETVNGNTDDLFTRTFAAFRAEMWQILGRTTLDAMRTVDWVLEGREDLPVAAGGLSMGGDMAVALAGIDTRIGRVAAVASTPDWTRPGMHALDGDHGVIDQGEPTASSAWLEQHLDPMRHVSAFDRDLDILFIQGAADTHVPPEASQRFRDLLAPSRAHVEVELTPGLGHEVCLDPRAQHHALLHLVDGAGDRVRRDR